MVEPHVRPQLVLADSGLPCDTFNFICRARLDGATVEPAALDEVSYFARVRRPFSWWGRARYQPKELGAVLEQLSRLERAETELAMALPLAAFPEPSAQRPGSGCHRVPDGSRAFEILAEITAANWSPPDPYVPRCSTSGRPPRSCAQGLRSGFTSATCHGEPVATAEATVVPGQSLGCSTLPPINQPSEVAVSAPC